MTFPSLLFLKRLPNFNSYPKIGIKYTDSMFFLTSLPCRIDCYSIFKTPLYSEVINMCSKVHGLRSSKFYCILLHLFLHIHLLLNCKLYSPILTRSGSVFTFDSSAYNTKPNQRKQLISHH